MLVISFLARMSLTYHEEIGRVRRGCYEEIAAVEFNLKTRCHAANNQSKEPDTITRQSSSDVTGGVNWL